LPAHNGEVMAKDQDLDIFVIGGPEMEHNQVKGATGGPVEEAKRHDSSLLAEATSGQARKALRRRSDANLGTHGQLEGVGR
jgi:hypothetical protein